MVSFSTGRTVLADFDTTLDVDELHTIIDNAPHINRATRIGSTLGYIANNLIAGGTDTGRRPNSRAAVVVVLDGDTIETEDVFADGIATLHATGADVFALGVGSSVSQDTLLAIVSGKPNDHILAAYNVTELASPAFAISAVELSVCPDETSSSTSTSTSTSLSTASNVEEPNLGLGCAVGPVRADVVFVLDSSSGYVCSGLIGQKKGNTGRGWTWSKQVGAYVCVSHSPNSPLKPNTTALAAPAGNSQKNL